MEMSGQHQSLPFYQGKDLEKGDWLGPLNVWIRAEKFDHTVARTPNIPGRNESLYRLRYPINYAK
jgi:hypothetical protein